MVARKGTRYEERRRKTLEENKKRMEELNLNKLSQSLCKPEKKVKPRPLRQSVDISLARRSTRVADISYREKVAETIAQKKLNEDLAKDDSDSKAMKRPLSAFFIFMRKFRNLFKQNFPENKSMFAVGKAAGEEWRSMSDSDKAPYVAMAAKKKADYDKAKEEFKNKTNGNGSTSTAFEKSSSEVHDEADHEATS